MKNGEYAFSSPLRYLKLLPWKHGANFYKLLFGEIKEDPKYIRGNSQILPQRMEDMTYFVEKHSTPLPQLRYQKYIFHCLNVFEL